MTECICGTCGETFTVTDGEIGDMSLAGLLIEHIQKEDGTDCGGTGKIVGSWS